MGHSFLHRSSLVFIGHHSRQRSGALDIWEWPRRSVEAAGGRRCLVGPKC